MSRSRFALVAALVAGIAASADAQQLSSVWIEAPESPPPQFWSDGSNWSTDPLAPNNGKGGFTYDVTVDGNAHTVVFEEDVTIDRLSLQPVLLGLGAARRRAARSRRA